MKKILAISALLTPSLVLAQGAITNIESLASRLQNIGDLIIRFLIALAFLWIIWKVVQFIMHADNEEKRSEDRNGIIWGIVGLAVIFSIWGLVTIVKNTFRTDDTGPTQPPTLPRIR